MESVNLLLFRNIWAFLLAQLAFSIAVATAKIVFCVFESGAWDLK